ncbi:hypothetical protein AALO_G00169100 [Alosa alosa]|uniref:Uncharacterized protein n=1 Tax=Alosa alosa TaxID=278164 RepID=A0AAV6GD57_9TELE|nr:hypothetical protein AALO_G00169100 [Alosa alosa]
MCPLAVNQGKARESVTRSEVFGNIQSTKSEALASIQSEFSSMIAQQATVPFTETTEWHHFSAKAHVLGDECLSGAVSHALQECHGVGTSRAAVTEALARSTEWAARHRSCLPPLPGHCDVPGHGVEVVAP